MSVNPMFHTRSKHIELDYHFVREKMAMGTLINQYISSSSQPTDLFTKPLPKDTFIKFRSTLGVHFHSLSSLREHEKENISKRLTSGNTEGKDQVIIAETMLAQDQGHCLESTKDTGSQGRS